MFASQLLRILQTIPADVNASETGEVKANMKEEEPDTLTFAVKDFDCPNGRDKDVDHFALQNREPGFWDFSKDGDRDALWDVPELECSMIIENDFVSRKKEEGQDSTAQVVTSSGLFPPATELSSHKHVESELRKLIACYKEINYHVVKEISTKEGKGVTDRSGLSLPRLPNARRQEETAGDFAVLVFDDGSRDHSDNRPASECETKEGDDTALLVPGEPASSSDGTSQEDSTQAYETNKVENGVSESVVTSILPLKEYGTRSFLRSFMDSLNNDGDEAANDESAENTDQTHVMNHQEGGFSPFTFTETDATNCNNPFVSEEVPDGISAKSQENPLTTSIPSADQGESSFSSAGASVSGLITFSGPITQSGSTSVRSDSSANSTRSFAFPVLQPEWTSSPVRMGKADEQNTRKQHHRGWKQVAWRALCCSGRLRFDS